MKTNEEIMSEFISTLAESGPDDDITEDAEFNEAFRRSGTDTAPGPDNVRYSDIKNPIEHDRT